VSSQFRVSFFFFCGSYEIQSIQHVFTINAWAWYLPLFFLFCLVLVFFNRFTDNLQCCPFSFAYCWIKINLIIDQLFFFPSIILVCRCYHSISYGATESCSRLRRLQYASTTVQKKKHHNLFLKSIIFSFSEYYDYELHVVEWGYVNKQLIEKKQKVIYKFFL